MNKQTGITPPAASSGVGNPSGTLVAADWERPSWRITLDGEDHFDLPKDSLASDTFMSTIAGHTLVIEMAHLQPRNKFSVAQVFTDAELDELHLCAQRHNVKILAFPERMTAGAREECGFRELGTNSKDEEVVLHDDKTRSAEAIWRFVTANPRISLFRWQPVNAKRAAIHEARTEQRMDCNARLNEMRTDYSASPEVERARTLLTEITLPAAESGVGGPLSGETLEWFGVKFYKVGSKKGQLREFNPTSVMAVYVNVFNDDGTLRMHNGRFVGVDHIWRVLKQHPYHGKAGTARSNLMYHMLRNAEKKATASAGGYYPHQATRASFRRAVKELIRAFRDVALTEIKAPAATSGVEIPLGSERVLETAS